MAESKKTYSLVIVIAAFVVGAVLAYALAAGTMGGNSQAGTDTATTSETTEASDGSGAAASTDVATAFPSWNADSPALAKLTAFVEDVTDESSANYVEPKDRIATFDMDGTVLCERAPVYADYCLLLHRVLDDPSYKADPATVKLCKQLRANADEGVVDGDLNEQKSKAFADVFKDMTDEEFRAYVNDFLDTVPAEGFEGMTYGESFYQPMREVVDYLRANDFDVYMVSACEREVVRAAVLPRLGIEPDHVLGTDLGFKATDQGDEAGIDYNMTQEDKITMYGEMFDECGKLNKVLAIQREIGEKPILAFGNSSGDFSMLNYAQSNDAHKGMGVLIVADDLEREYGNEEKAASMREEIEKEGWLGVSMRDDWATIYGEGVERTALVADQELANAA